jgi:hypothetical protein
VSHESMQMLLDTVQRYCWTSNVAGLLIIIVTRLLWHSRRAWGIAGFVLLSIAAVNAITISHVGLNPSQTAASIFGVVVLGSLGSRFFGNWLADGAS